MGKVYYIMAVFAAVFFTACQEDDFRGDTQGGIRITLAEEVGVDVTTRSTPEELTIPVEKDFTLKVVDQATNDTIYNGKYTSEIIPVSAGTYTIIAEYGEDVVLDADKPYYKGIAEDVQVSNSVIDASISCSVANALVSVILEDETTFKQLYPSAYFKVKIGNTEKNFSDYSQSAYFKAGSSLSLLTLYKNRTDGDHIDLLAKAKEVLKNDFPDPFKAKDHLKITLGLENTGSGVSIEVVKAEIDTITISETIPLEWLPKPKVEADGFTNNALTFVETETPNAKLNLDLASALQDIRLKFNFGDNQFTSLNRDTGYLYSNAEDKAIIETTLGISVSDDNINLNNLLAKIQTNAGETTTNTIEVDVKANNRWSSEDEAVNRTYTITCNKPVFKVDAYPGNIWTKEFTMNALREEQVESGDFSKISQNIKYQYSTDGESNWTNLGDDLRQANLTPGTTYYIRGLYRDAVPGEMVEVNTYEAMDIPNSTFDDGYDTTYPKDDNPLYIFKGDWIDTRNELTCHSEGVNAFYVSKSSTLPISENGSTVAHMMVIGWGKGNTCDFGNKRNSVINNISSGFICVGNYDANSDAINAKKAYIRPSSLTFTYKASPYNGDEYLIEATLLNIADDGETTIVGKGRLQSGTSIGNYSTETITIEYDDSAKELPISHVKVLFQAGTKEDRDHLEDDFRDASIWEGYSNAYIIGSQFWLDSFHFNYDK